MIKPILSLASLFLCLNSYAQIYLNPGVDTSFNNVKTALHFYNSYVAEFNHGKIPEMAKYWPASEIEKRKIPDQIIYALNESPLYSQGLQLTIIYVRPTDQYVHIKTQFAWSDSSKHISTMAVVNYYVGFDSRKQPYFINPMTVNLSDWHSKSVRNVTFYYPPNHRFNVKKADSLISRIIKLEKDWGLKPINIRYYLASDNDELYTLRGFDYALSMGNKQKPSGISDDKDNQVFCGGLGENYFHEVVHIYLNHLYPKSPLQEGLAVLYGGSMGHTIKWHLKRVNQYLLQHPQANLNNLDDFWYTDPYTNPGSAIQGMICDLVYQKDGIPGLKKLMTYTSYKEIFENEFHVSADHINDFLRKTISDQADH
jgi:hypothetical protein